MSTASPRLLVIDDEPGICQFISEVAGLAGYEASSTCDPKQLDTLDLLVDVIVLDLLMPAMDGVEVVRELAKRGCRARLIFSSGVERKILDSAARAASAHGLEVAARLPKPVRAAELKSLLEDLAKRRAVQATAKPSAFEPTVTELALAIEKDELVVHCQPQISLSDGRWIGVEALVRWQHANHGLLYPDRFIALAEQHGLGLSMTYRVLEHALRQCGVFREQVGFSGMLSVNVPAVALYDLAFPEEVLARANAAGGWPNLTFEVTETSVSAELAAALDVLTRLRMKGIGLSIDDFGTGQSGMERLYQLPFTELKIDMQFVRAAPNDDGARAIVENSIRLAGDLGLKVVAEGVEDVGIWNWLSRRGCDFAQGYFISRPVSSERLIEWSQKWKPPAA
jgi:EAL domain-containing protein (putative c-di-GMP-specific phosphodiesterase class I)/CheY-like chemotaxis protein